jgi:dipeptidase D
MKPNNYPSEPAHLWQHFYQFTQTPRPSKEEQAIRQYVIDQAEALGHRWAQDAEGNLVVYVAGSAGREDEASVIVQNHLDMVTVKTDDKAHDFHRDPLDLKVEDGWLLADRTTLGADNGLGCAAALALMTDAEVSRPPLELLFTVDEETGLGGALNLDASLLSGKLMLNLDTEDWNELYVGCAGGGGWEFRRQLATAAAPSTAEHWQLSLKGLAGGHSGVQIHEQLGNAIKLLSQLLYEVDGLQLSAFDAGVAHNVIPREARAVFAAAAGQEAQLREQMVRLRAQWVGFLPGADSQLELILEPAETNAALSEDDSRLVLDLVMAMPHGAQSYNLAQPADLVDLSINLALLRLDDGKLFVESSFRFFNDDPTPSLCRGVEAIARQFGLEITPVAGYPGWQPNFDSPLLERGKALHAQMFGYEPDVKAIHAGLECGILLSKKPDMDILSFGPTIRGAHSPTERLEIATVPPFWQYLTTLLAQL